MELSLTAKMSSEESLAARFDKIDAMLKDPKSEVNTDCLLVSILTLVNVCVSVLLALQLCFDHVHLYCIEKDL